MRTFLFGLGIAAVAVSGTASAGIVSFNFNTGNQGWQTGDVASAIANTNGMANWSNGQLVVTDIANQAGVFAPTDVLGNQSAAYNGSISFDVSDTLNDGVPYAALILYGTNGFAASVDAGPPSTNNSALTTFSFVLNESVFGKFTGGYNTGGAITQAEFQAILGNLSGIGFTTEYNTGGDDSRFDNAVFNGFANQNAPGGVPEPATWALTIAGFGAIGGAMRRRSNVRTKIAFA